MTTEPTPPFLDSSFVIRYLTDDPPDLAARAAEVIDDGQPLVLTETVLMESAYVLEKIYGVSRSAVVDTLSALVQKSNIRLATLAKPRALEALGLCRDSRRVSFADALVWAEARERGAPLIYSFDRRFPSRGLQVVGKN